MNHFWNGTWRGVGFLLDFENFTISHWKTKQNPFNITGGVEISRHLFSQIHGSNNFSWNWERYWSTFIKELLWVSKMAHDAQELDELLYRFFCHLAVLNGNFTVNIKNGCPLAKYTVWLFLVCTMTTEWQQVKCFGVWVYLFVVKN